MCGASLDSAAGKCPSCGEARVPHRRRDELKLWQITLILLPGGAAILARPETVLKLEAFVYGDSAPGPLDVRLIYWTCVLTRVVGLSSFLIGTGFAIRHFLRTKSRNTTT